MVPREHGDEAIVADGNGKEEEVGVMGVGAADGDEEQHGAGGKFSVTSFLWHGGSVWDAWFSCASNQVSNIQQRREREREREIHKKDMIAEWDSSFVCCRSRRCS